jgi:hypothetical protein
VSLQFVIHSFEALINNRSLRLAIFWELLKTEPLARPLAGHKLLAG